MLEPAAAQRVSDALRRSSYTVDAVAALDPTDLDVPSPLATLVRLFLRGEPLDADAVGQVLPLADA
ncbi:MAG TPA: hypothetical protein VHW92_12425, partial [Mycobacteriales bacterium]|nr:hypothetical protein [Mycobacteriales bacterium]